MDTTGLRFWHGTSATAAIGILSEGARDFPSELGASNLAKEIWPPILQKVGDEYETAALFQQAAGSDSVAWPVVLKILHEDKSEGTQYCYGQFYVTTSRRKAARYARRNRSGSEILSVIEDGLKVIDQFDRMLGDRLRTSYPELIRRLSLPPHPIVLELSGIRADRLTDDTGEAIDDWQEEIELVVSSDSIVEPAFRIAGVKPADVVGVYDLANVQGSAEQPIPLERWEQIQASPAKWLLAQKARYHAR